jgi:hypothetical protein
MPRTTGSFDLAFGALEARLRIAIRKEVTDLLAAERKRRGLDRPMTRFLWCPLPMRPGRHHAPQDRQLSAGRTAHRARSRRACAAIEPLCIHHLLQFVEERLGKASRHGSGKTDYSDHSTPAGAAAVRAMARNPTAPPVQHPRCADRTTARHMTRSRGQVRFEPVITWPPLQMRGFEHRTVLPAGGDGRLRCLRVARRQGHHGPYRQNAGTQPDL